MGISLRSLGNEDNGFFWNWRPIVEVIRSLGVILRRRSMLRAPAAANATY